MKLPEHKIATKYLFVLITLILVIYTQASYKTSIYGYVRYSKTLNTSIDTNNDDIYLTLNCDTDYRFKIFPLDSNLYCKTTDAKFKAGICKCVYDQTNNDLALFVPPMPAALANSSSTYTCRLFVERYQSGTYTTISSSDDIIYDLSISANLMNIFPSQATLSSRLTFDINLNIYTGSVTLYRMYIGEYYATISNSNTTTLDPCIDYYVVVLKIDSLLEFNHITTGEKLKPGFYKDIFVTYNYGISYYNASTSVLYTNSLGNLDYWDLEIIGYITQTKVLLDSGSTFLGLETKNQLLEVTGYLGNSTDSVNIYIGNSDFKTENYCKELSRTMLTGVDIGKMTIICKKKININKTATSLELPPRGGKVTEATGDANIVGNLNKLYMNLGEYSTTTLSTKSYQTLTGVFCPTNTAYSYRFIANIDDIIEMNYTINDSIVQDTVYFYILHYSIDYFDTKNLPDSYKSYFSDGWINFTTTDCKPFYIKLSFFGILDFARLSYEYCDNTLTSDCNDISASVSSTLDNEKAWQVYTFSVSSNIGSFIISCSGLPSKTVSYSLTNSMRERDLIYLLYYGFKDMGIISDSDSDDKIRFISYFQSLATLRDTHTYDFVIEINYYKKIEFACSSGCSTTIMKQYNHNKSRRFVDAELFRMAGFDFSDTLNRQLLVYYSEDITEKNRATCDSNECIFKVQDANYYPIITSVDITYVRYNASNLVLKYIITTSNFSNYNNSDNDTYIIIGDNSIQEGVINTTFQYAAGVFTIEEVNINLDNNIQYPIIITKYGSLKVNTNLYDCNAYSTKGTLTKNVNISSVTANIEVFYCNCNYGLFAYDVSCLTYTDEHLKYVEIPNSTFLYIICDVSEYFWEGDCLNECPIYTEITTYTINTVDYNYCSLCSGSKMALRNVCVDVCDKGYSITHNTDCNCDYCQHCEGSFPFEYEFICYSQCPLHTSHSSGSYECFLCPNLYDITSMKCLDECYTGYYYEGTICYPCDAATPYSFHNYCYSACPLGTQIDPITNSSCTNCDSYYDLSTLACVEECTNTQITNDVKKECISCSEPTIYRNFDTYTCLETCPKGYITDYDKFKCISAGDRFIYNNKIVKFCPDYYLANEDTRLCYLCSTSDLMYQNGECKDKCDTDYVYVDYSIDNTYQKVCLNCTGYLYLQSSKDLLKISNNLSYISLDYIPECNATCSEGSTSFSNGKYCYEKSTITNSSNSDSVSSEASSNMDDNSNIVCESGYEKTLENEVYRCKSCRNLNKYNQNGSCVTTCSSEYTANSLTMQCLLCRDGEYSQGSGSTYECVATCDKSKGYYIDSTLTSTCTNCLKSEMLIDDNKCVTKCSRGKTPDSDGNCISCENSNLPYILDGTCVSKCPNNYRLVTYQRQKNVCSYYVKNPTCKDDSPCLNNSTCYIKNTEDLLCNCTTSIFLNSDGSQQNYYGSFCNYTDSYTSLLEQKISDANNMISSLSNSKKPLTDEQLEEISSIKKLIETTPEVVSDDLVNSLILLVNNQLALSSNSTSFTNSTTALLDVVDVAFRAVSSTGSSNSVTEIKSSISKMVTSILSAQSNITDFLASMSSSVLYSGSSFSIQLSDNSEEALFQARENGLSIVDYDKCERTLKDSGLLADDDSLFALNLSYDSSLLGSTNDAVSSSSSLSTIIVNTEGNVVDTSLCTSITVKTPINNNIDNTDSAERVAEDIGVDVYNSSESFFSDRCFPYSSNGTDSTLTSRRSDYNVSAKCSTGCSYEGVDEHSYTICNCDSTPLENVTTFESSVWNSLKNSNFLLITCLSTILNSNILSDVGFWAVCSLTILVLTISIFHSCLYNTKKNLKDIIYNDAITIFIPDKVGNANIDKGNSQSYNFDSKYNGDKNISTQNSNIIRDKRVNVVYDNIIILDDNNFVSGDTTRNKLNKDKIKFNAVNEQISKKPIINFENDNLSNIKTLKTLHEENNFHEKERILLNTIIPFKVGVKISEKDKEKHLLKDNLNKSSIELQENDNILYKKNNILNNNSISNITNINILDVAENEMNSNDNLFLGKNKDNARDKDRNVNRMIDEENSQVSEQKNNNFIKSSKSNESIDKYPFYQNKDNIEKKSSNDLGNLNAHQCSTYNIMDNITNKINEMNILEDNNEKEERLKRLKNVINTKRDLEILSHHDALVCDNRSFWRYIWDDIKETHPYINIILIASVLNAFYIRFLGIMFSISLEFAMNAMFYTDDYINKQSEVKTSEGKSTGFIYTLINDFSKSFWPVIISIIITFITSLIIKVPKRFKDRFNNCLNSSDDKTKLDGM